jgi:hypothetical protein
VSDGEVGGAAGRASDGEVGGAAGRASDGEVGGAPGRGTYGGDDGRPEPGRAVFGGGVVGRAGVDGIATLPGGGAEARGGGRGIETCDGNGGMVARTVGASGGVGRAAAAGGDGRAVCDAGGAGLRLGCVTSPTSGEVAEGSEPGSASGPTGSGRFGSRSRAGSRSDIAN